MTEILIKPETVACPGHGEHLRDQWPKGFMPFALHILHAALHGEALLAAVKEFGDAGNRVDRGEQIDGINAVLAKRPVCYFVDRDTVRQALLDCGVGRIGRCVLCRRDGPGGPYTVAMPARRELRHVCFECALDAGERMHREKPAGGVWS